jgi:hypothetical protein
VKHLLILLSFLLLSSPVIGDNHKGETLYGWKTSSGFVWKGFGEKYTNPKYQGDVEDGKPNGVGILIYPMGGKYVGGWKNGKNNGEGTYTYSWGGKYVGEWWDNVLWNGTYYNENGNITEKYVNGLKVEKRRKVVLFEREVDGVLGWYENGDEREDTKFVGEIKSGKQNGEGTQTYPDGRKYVGEWKNGVPNGQGTITYDNGNKYVGEWKNGEKNGQGIYTYSNGDTNEGEYKDGGMWNGRYYDKDGNIRYKYVNGKLIKQ